MFGLRLGLGQGSVIVRFMVVLGFMVRVSLEYLLGLG